MVKGIFAISFFVFTMNLSQLVGAQMTHQKYLGIDLKEVKDVCTSFKKPGECLVGAQKIALVTYDPLVFKKSTGELRENFQISKEVPGDSDCYLIKKDLEEKGYCIEGLAVEHASSIRDAILAQKELVGRYQYLANVTHGLPGAWVTRGQCESDAKKTCLQNFQFSTVEELNDCVEGEMSNSSQPHCPCHREYAALNQIHQAYRKNCQQPHFQNLLLTIGLQESAEYDYGRCQKEPAHLKFYSEEGDPGVYGRLASPQGDAFVYAVSCDTAKDPQATVTFKAEFCKRAANGTRFNMARTPTYAAFVIDAESARLFQINKIITDCSTGQCPREEGKSNYDRLISTAPSPIVRKYTNGDFVCFQCQSGAATSIDCNADDFPDKINIRGEKGKKTIK